MLTATAVAQMAPAKPRAARASSCARLRLGHMLGRWTLTMWVGESDPKLAAMVADVAGATGRRMKAGKILVRNRRRQIPKIATAVRGGVPRGVEPRSASRRLPSKPFWGKSRLRSAVASVVLGVGCIRGFYGRAGEVLSVGESRWASGGGRGVLAGGAHRRFSTRQPAGVCARAGARVALAMCKPQALTPQNRTTTLCPPPLWATTARSRCSLRS